MTCLPAQVRRNQAGRTRTRAGSGNARSSDPGSTELAALPLRSGPTGAHAETVSDLYRLRLNAGRTGSPVTAVRLPTTMANDVREAL